MKAIKAHHLLALVATLPWGGGCKGVKSGKAGLLFIVAGREGQQAQHKMKAMKAPSLLALAAILLFSMASASEKKEVPTGDNIIELDEFSFYPAISDPTRIYFVEFYAVNCRQGWGFACSSRGA